MLPLVAICRSKRDRTSETSTTRDSNRNRNLNRSCFSAIVIEIMEKQASARNDIRPRFKKRPGGAIRIRIKITTASVISPFRVTSSQCSSLETQQQCCGYGENPNVSATFVHRTLFEQPLTIVPPLKQAYLRGRTPEPQCLLKF